MNKKIFSATLFGALMALSTGTFVSCQDYDDDIDNLQQQITNNSSAIAALESQIRSGEWVQSVTSTADGVVITLGNGNSYTISNGQDGAAGQNGAAGKDGAAGQNGADGKDGAAGQNGVTPTIAVNNGKIQVSYNDGSTWTDLISLADLKGDTGAAGATGAKGDKGEQGAQGAQGAAGISPTFSLGEDGHIYAQYGEDGEKKDLGVSTGGVYCVIDGVKLTIHAPNADGEYQDIVLPRAAAISSIKAVTVEEDVNATLTDDAEITLYYGVATADGKFFDGTAYKQGDILLPTKNTGNVISAQINPTIADATAYNFYLVDSKGYSIFNLSDVTPNKTEKALTRTATANKGIYDMGVTLVSGVTAAQIAKAEGDYAIATKDVYDNEILSAYDVAVTLTPATSTSVSVTTDEQQVEINKEFDLNKLVTMENVVDVKYEFASTEAEVKAAGATISGTKIKGGVAGKTVKVKVKYLIYSGGEPVTESNQIAIKFVKAATVTAYTEELTLSDKDEKNVLTFDLTDLFGNTTSTISSSSYTIGEAKFTAAAKDKNDGADKAKGDDAVGITKPGSITTGNASTTANGYYKHTLTYTVAKESVIPGTYEAVVTYGTAPVDTIKLTLVVKDPAVSYDFKPKSLLFNGTETTVYGTPNSEDPVKIEYDLKNLFGLTEAGWANVSFSETVPTKYKEGKVTWTANAWLVADQSANLGEIEVDKAKLEKLDEAVAEATFGGAYEARSLKATYTPYGNKNLAAATYDFSVTVKSPVYEGSLEYVKKVTTGAGSSASTTYVAGDTKTVKAGAPATLKADEIRGVTMEGKVYSGKSAEIEDFGSGTHEAANVVSVKVALGGDAKDYLTLSGEDFTSEITISLQGGISIPSGTTINGYVRVSVVDKWGKTKTVDVPVVLK